MDWAYRLLLARRRSRDLGRDRGRVAGEIVAWVMGQVAMAWIAMAQKGWDRYGPTPHLADPVRLFAGVRGSLWPPAPLIDPVRRFFARRRFLPIDPVLAGALAGPRPWALGHAGALACVGGLAGDPPPRPWALGRAGVLAFAGGLAGNPPDSR